MTPSRFEVIKALPPPASRGLGRRNPAPVVAGLAVLGLAGALSWTLERQRAGARLQQDERTLEQAVQTFDHALEQQRRLVQSQAALLADDTRVRTPLMMPSLDEATLRDVLEVLKRVSGATF